MIWRFFSWSSTLTSKWYDRKRKLKPTNEKKFAKLWIQLSVQFDIALFSCLLYSLLHLLQNWGLVSRLKVEYTADIGGPNLASMILTGCVQGIVKWKRTFLENLLRTNWWQEAVQWKLLAKGMHHHLPQNQLPMIAESQIKDLNIFAPGMKFHLFFYIFESSFRSSDLKV